MRIHRFQVTIAVRRNWTHRALSRHTAPLRPTAFLVAFIPSTFRWGSAKILSGFAPPNDVMGGRALHERSDAVMWSLSHVTPRRGSPHNRSRITIPINRTINRPIEDINQTDGSHPDSVFALAIVP